MNHTTRPLKPLAHVIGVKMLFIVTLSLFAVCVSFVTLVYSLRDAEVVNISGSMRMQSYRLATDLLVQPEALPEHIQNYQDSLNADVMLALNSPFVPKDIRTQYSDISKRWQELSQQLQSEDRMAYLQEVQSLVAQIDRFVYSLQEFSEFKLKLLTIVGGVCVLFILFCAIFIMRFVRREVVHPLESLVKASKQVQAKNFDVKLETNSLTELGILGSTFEQMAADLKHLYTGLEALVDQKTQALQKANQSLNLLYHSSESISAARLTTSHFQQILEYMLQIQGVAAVSLKIEQYGDNNICLEAGMPNNQMWHTYPLTQGQLNLGILKWQATGDEVDRDLIESMARMMARGIYFEQGQKRAEQVILMEERATIARELHDSLAQSLSYLKIQVVLLKRSMTQSQCRKVCAPAEDILLEIEDVLSNAYIQLRELLNTFRLSVEEADFGVALSQILEPLKTQTKAEFHLNNELSSIEISAAKQVHLLQFIREACINAIKHANASQINVNCIQTKDQIQIQIKDNGIGFDPSHEKPNHYGLNIMQERASRLQAKCQILSKPDEGCEVNLTMSLLNEENECL